MLSGALYKSPVGEQSNYFIVTPQTTKQEIQQKFEQYTQNQQNTVVFICKSAAEKIRRLIDDYKEVTPVILEIPSATDTE